MKGIGLNGNALKIIAMLTMAIDHIGLVLLNDCLPFRIIGRLAFPIYAYLIAEGCFYTKNKKRHFLEVFLLGAVCQSAYYIAEGELYLNVLLTFSLSIPLVYLLERTKKEIAFLPLLLLATAGTVLAVELLAGVGILFDYGSTGVLLPVFVAVGKNRRQKLCLFALGLIMLSLLSSLGYQWYCLFALLPILLYSGERGRFKLKYVFYLFYPVHLLIIYGISLLL